MSIEKRKNDHITVCLEQNVRSEAAKGFERYRLVHNALPEADFAEYSTETVFLGKGISAPLLISSMTGGTVSGERINRNLLGAAEKLRLPFAIGSQRIYLADPDRPMPPVRELAPTVPVLANVGAVQLNYGFGRDHLLRAVEGIGADALILHLNPLQELIQRSGDTDFSGLLGKIEKICADFPVPVIVKEVGWGISPENAVRLWNAGVSMIDVAGAGGTSWSRVEAYAAGNETAQAVAGPFADWGIPTAECIRRIHSAYPDIPLIASGGITNGVEAAKAVALGASLCGMAAVLLEAAAKGNADDVSRVLETISLQYKIASFLSSGIERTDQEHLNNETKDHQ